jgi:uncharacterized protein (TIGR03437 family)
VGGGGFQWRKCSLPLEGTKVTIAGQPGFVEYVSPGQVNVQVPSIPLGSQTLVVTSAAGSSSPYTLTVNEMQPAR